MENSSDFSPADVCGEVGGDVFASSGAGRAGGDINCQFDDRRVPVAFCVDGVGGGGDGVGLGGDSCGDGHGRTFVCGLGLVIIDVRADG